MINEIVKKAKDYSFRKHDLPSDCQRYGNEPYSVHLDSVVDTIKKYLYLIKEDEYDDVLSAGYLHDTVEDTDTSPRVLKEFFNDRIADIVFRVTNERGYDRKEKNFKTYPKIWVSDLAIFVKICDRISNTRNSKTCGHRMYKVYTEEYPIFRYALKVRGLYNEMWDELDELYNYV